MFSFKMKRDSFFFSASLLSSERDVYVVMTLSLYTTLAIKEKKPQKKVAFLLEFNAVCRKTRVIVNRWIIQQQKKQPGIFSIRLSFCFFFNYLFIYCARPKTVYVCMFWKVFFFFFVLCLSNVSITLFDRNNDGDEDGGVGGSDNKTGNAIDN